jgi:hypothetical protein
VLWNQSRLLKGLHLWLWGSVPSHLQSISPITTYLNSLDRPIDSHCEQGHYYLLNDYNPGYYGSGANAYADIGNPNETVFTIPPSPLHTIGDRLIEKNISWAYYGDQWNAYLANPDGNLVTPDNASATSATRSSTPRR